MPSKKTLFIFDIDSTLTKFDSCLFTYKYTLGEEAYNKAVELAKVENWVDSFYDDPYYDSDSGVVDR